MDIRDKILDQHKDGMGYKTISKKLSVKVTTLAAIIQKWKKFKMTVSCLWSAAPCKILPHRVRMILRKMVNQLKTTLEELVNNPKTLGTAVTKNTVRNTLQYAVD